MVRRPGWLVVTEGKAVRRAVTGRRDRGDHQLRHPHCPTQFLGRERSPAAGGNDVLNSACGLELRWHWGGFGGPAAGDQSAGGPGTEGPMTRGGGAAFFARQLRGRGGGGGGGKSAPPGPAPP